MTRRALVLLTVLLSGTAVLAHHSAALFDLSKTLTLTGTVTKIDWRNPHVIISVDVKGDAGNVDAWVFETGAPSWFRGRMIGKSDFENAVGQPVTIEAVRAKDGSAYGYLYRVTFSGGKGLELR
jgi:hypothetical protein